MCHRNPPWSAFSSQILSSHWAQIWRMQPSHGETAYTHAAARAVWCYTQPFCLRPRVWGASCISGPPMGRAHYHMHTKCRLHFQDPCERPDPLYIPIVGRLLGSDRNHVRSSIIDHIISHTLAYQLPSFWTWYRWLARHFVPSAKSGRTQIWWGNEYLMTSANGTRVPLLSGQAFFYQAIVKGFPHLLSFHLGVSSARFVPEPWKGSAKSRIPVSCL